MGFFNSPLQDAIEEATDERRPEPDWARFMQIVDGINRQSDGPKDAIKTIGKRIDSGNHKQQTLALTLLDTCLKNCNMRFISKFSKEGFQKILKEVVMSKKTLPIVRDRMLEMIEVWANEFRAHPEKFPDSFFPLRTYDELKREGVTFPVREHQGPRAPMFTPPARTSGQAVATSAAPPGMQSTGYPSGYGMYPAAPTPASDGYPAPPQYSAAPYSQGQYPSQAYPPGQYAPAAYAQSGYPPQYAQAGPQHGAHRGRVPPAAPAPMSSEAQRRKLIDDMNIVRESINILAEALNSVNPIAEDVSRNEVIREFAQSCTQMRPRVVQLVESINDEAILAELLVLTDHLNRVLEAHQTACRRQPIPHQAQAPPPWSGSAPPAGLPAPEAVATAQPVAGPWAYGGSAEPPPVVVSTVPHAAPSVAPSSVLIDLDDARPVQPSQGAVMMGLPVDSEPADALAALSLGSTAASATSTTAPAARPVHTGPLLERPPAQLPPRRLPPLQAGVASQASTASSGGAPPTSLPPLLPEYSSYVSSAVGGAAPALGEYGVASAAATGGAQGGAADAGQDEFDAIARRHLGSAPATQPQPAAAQDPLDDEFAAIATRHDRAPTSPAADALGLSGAHTVPAGEYSGHDRRTLLDGSAGAAGQGRTAGTPAVPARNQEYMQMRSDDLFDL